MDAIQRLASDWQQLISPMKFSTLQHLFLATVVAFFATRLAAADAIVAADGNAQYKSVQEAINAAPQLAAPGKIWTILVKPGAYAEVVYVQREKRFIHLVGENAETTKITASYAASTIGHDGKPLGTFRTATVQIDADDFTVENLTFENAAGPVGQALALRVDGDRVAFRNCRFLGWQDTILVNRGRHYFKNCFVAGATDFIFGAATAFFDGCTIRCDGAGYVTAASTPLEQPYGLIFSRCKIFGSKPDIRTYLGRPWRQYAMTVFLDCEMSEVIRSEGWHNWGKPEREQTARYAEHGNTGNGADTSKRVSWARQFSTQEASALTIEKVLAGNDGWRPDAAKP
jgi:pectinesterase